MIKGTWTKEATYYSEIPCYRLYGEEYLGSVFVYDDGSIKASAGNYGVSSHTSVHHAKTALEEYFGLVDIGAEELPPEIEKLVQLERAVDSADTVVEDLINDMQTLTDARFAVEDLLDDARAIKDGALEALKEFKDKEGPFNHGEARVSFEKKTTPEVALKKIQAIIKELSR